MKVDFNHVLLTLDGSAFTEPAPLKPGQTVPDAVPVTLKDIAVRSLTAPMEEDKGLTGEQAFKRLELARAVHKGGEQEIDAADAVLIRDRAAKLYGIAISGQVYELLR